MLQSSQQHALTCTHTDLHTPLSTTLLLMFAPQHMHKHTHGDTVHSRTQHKQTPHQHTPGNTCAHPTLHTCTHLSDTQCTLCLTYSGAHFAGAVKQQSQLQAPTHDLEAANPTRAVFARTPLTNRTQAHITSHKTHTMLRLAATPFSTPLALTQCSQLITTDAVWLMMQTVCLVA